MLAGIGQLFKIELPQNSSHAITTAGDHHDRRIAARRPVKGRHPRLIIPGKALAASARRPIELNIESQALQIRQSWAQ